MHLKLKKIINVLHSRRRFAFRAKSTLEIFPAQLACQVTNPITTSGLREPHEVDSVGRCYLCTGLLAGSCRSSTAGLEAPFPRATSLLYTTPATIQPVPRGEQQHLRLEE